MTALRIKKYRISARGKRGLVFTMPKQQLEDLGVGQGDELSMYKAVLGGRPVIILANSDAAVLDDERSQQGAELASFMAGQGVPAAAGASA